MSTFATEADQIADEKRSLNDWKKLHRQVLQNKCNQYHLEESGYKKALAARLFAHFNPSSSDTESLPSDDGSDDEEEETAKTAGNSLREDDPPVDDTELDYTVSGDETGTIIIIIIKLY